MKVFVAGAIGLLLVVPAEAQAPRVKRDLVYATVGGKNLALDLYMPANVASPPLVVWVHGGRWMNGTKADVPMQFVEHGIATASVDFRQSTEARFPAMIHDIKAAIRFLRAKASEHGYRSDRIAIAGASSGAHLAALVGVTNGHKELEGTLGDFGTQSSAVQAIVSYYAASNLTTILAQSTPYGVGVRKPALQNLLGALPEQNPELAKLASPVMHVDKNDPPLLLLHGDQESADADQPVARARRRLRDTGPRRLLRRRPWGGARRWRSRAALLFAGARRPCRRLPAADHRPAGEVAVIDRRTFLAAISAGAAASAVARTMAQTPRLETFTQWINASRDDRVRALQPALDHIRATDSAIHAWVQVQPQRPTGEGPLAEIPFGAKDIMETRGLSTEYGSPIYKGRIGTADAAIVRDLRARGAVLMGKTHTTAFAYREPAPTVNPRNHDHTPGGSSSGSAAAVAAGMIPFALGTQTMGSVLRPASYCGVTGFKGTFGRVSLEGVLPFAKSLDTLGFFTHTPADMLALWEAMGHPGGRAEDLDIAVPDPIPQVEAPMVSAFQNAVAALRRGGVAIRTVNIAGMLADLHDAANTVEFYEGARFHEQRYREHGARLAHMGELVQKGLTISVETYRRGQAPHRGREDPRGRDVQGDAADPRARRDRAGAAGSRADRRLADEFALDRARHARYHDADAGRRRASAGRAADGGARSGRPGDPRRGARVPDAQRGRTEWLTLRHAGRSPRSSSWSR